MNRTGVCQSCGSPREHILLSEICLHLGDGLEGLGKPAVFVFPRITVCLECGSAQFTIPDAELKLIKENL